MGWNRIYGFCFQRDEGNVSLWNRSKHFSDISIQFYPKTIFCFLYCLGRWLINAHLLSSTNFTFYGDYHIALPIWQNLKPRPASSKINSHYSYVASISGAVVFVPSSAFHVFSVLCLVPDSNRYQLGGMNKIFCISTCSSPSSPPLLSPPLLHLYTGRVLYCHQLWSKSILFPLYH